MQQRQREAETDRVPLLHNFNVLNALSSSGLLAPCALMNWERRACFRKTYFIGVWKISTLSILHSNKDDFP